MCLNWLDQERKLQQYSVSKIAALESQEWKLRDGIFEHNTGRFFKVVGLQWECANGARGAAPFIDQPEVGILAFAVYEGEGTPELLVDAKFEPGNSMAVDAAPTFQATQSNQDSIHGGERPRLHSLFTRPEDWYSHVKQSEQGTRFINKWNLNLIRKVDARLDAPTGMKWIPFADLKRLILRSFSLNTDARSVLVTADWNCWATNGKALFTSNDGPLARQLRHSNETAVSSELENEVRGILEAHFSRYIFHSQRLPLTLIDDKLVLDTKQVSEVLINHYQVYTRNREKLRWDQPLLKPPSASFELLIASTFKQTLKFCFSPVTEVGFTERAELGNTFGSRENFCMRDERLTLELMEQLMQKGERLAFVSQNDEGGRFDQQLVDYEIRYIPNHESLGALRECGLWLSISEIRSLVQRPGYFNNEARTALSLLLAWI